MLQFRRLFVLTVAATVVIAGCSSSSKSSAKTTAPSPAVVTVTTTVSASALASGTPAAESSAGQPVAASAPGSAVASAAAPAQNALVTPAIRAQLLAAYLQEKGFAADQITGTRPGGVYYAYLPSTNTYWASATFQIAANATEATGIAMQDGGAGATYTRVGTTGPWQLTEQGEPWPCPGDLPASVLSVWHLSIVDGCVVAQAISPSHDAQTQTATFNDLPDGTYFGDIVYADVDYSGQGTMQFDAVTWVGSAAPMNKVNNLANLNFDTTATASYSVGTGAADSHVVTGTIDKAFIDNVTRSFAAFSTNLRLGYEVTIKADAIVSIEQFNALTPSQPDPHFTEPTS